MSKFVVFVDNSIIGSGGAAFAGAATEKSSVSTTSVSRGLRGRRMALSQVASALFKPDAVPHGVALGLDAFGAMASDPLDPVRAQILEGVGAIVLDDDDVAPGRLEGILGLQVIEDFTLRLPAPLQAQATPLVPDWHLSQIGARATGMTGQGVLVGVLDTGIDASHPEFAGMVLHFAEFDAGGALVSTIPRDAGDHGTHVCGLIAGGTRGVAPRASLAVAAVLTGPEGSGHFVQILSGMNWLITQQFRPDTVGVDVVNASLGAPGYHGQMRAAVTSARALGVLTIAAIGNDGTAAGQHGSPGNYPDVLGVGATDAVDRAAGFSAWGVAPPPSGPVYPIPGISAPGVLVDSAVPGGVFARKSGTSMATPIISGVAAQRLQASPALRGNPTALEADLKARVQPVGIGPNGNHGGIGRIVA